MGDFDHARGSHPPRLGIDERGPSTYRGIVTIDAFVQARDAVLKADESDLSIADVLVELLASLHLVADFDQTALLLTDTDTMLPFGGLVEGWTVSECVPFWDNELLDPDFAKFNDLARSSDPVVALSEATDGDLTRSPRFRKLFEPGAIADELRVAFTTGSSCWAVASLLRDADRGWFSADEVGAVRNLVPIGAQAVRSAVTRDEASAVAGGPGMIVIGLDGAVESITPDAETLLEEFAIPGVDLSPTTPVLAAARRAKGHRGTGRISLPRQRHIRTVVPHPRIAPRRRRARRGDHRGGPPLRSRADPAGVLRLDPREAEVVPLLARGLSTKEMAAELTLSRHTVSDHMKLIFTKCGVTSRGELVAKLFTEHISVGHDANTLHA